MTEQERYETVDLPFYRDEVAPVLPPEVLDFHAHVWNRECWKHLPWKADAAGAKYMVTLEAYGVEDLLADAGRMFPDRRYGAVAFGYPTPAADLDKTNRYAAEAGQRSGIYPVLITGRDMIPPAELEKMIRERGFFGYKVYLNWHGDNYGDITVEDMIGPAEMSLANELGLVVHLHVPRAGRLADPVVQRGVRDCAKRYPNARIVLAHCGRCYLPDEMKNAIGSIRDLENVAFDTAMVMDPTVLQIAFEGVGPERVVFGTDLPIAAMRGRRVYAMDHWVDVVLPGYPPSAYRVASADIRATFMVYEIILAIRRAGDMAGLSPEDLAGVFFDNGMALLRRAAGKA